MRIATFNVQNLRLRSRHGSPVLDGAEDQYQLDQKRPTHLARADRVETARVIADAKADIIALQEVFDLASLDFFHDQFLLPQGSPAFPYRYCLKGNDGRGLNVAVLSRKQPTSVKSHAEVTGDELGLSHLPTDLRTRPIFRRDCLELVFGTVTLFICHFKAPYPDPDRAKIIREAEARAVRQIVASRFEDPAHKNWIVLGDFNEPARSVADERSAIETLKADFAVDLLDRLAPGADWTYELPETHGHSRPDRILVSPSLARKYPDVCPRIIRSGMKATRQASDGEAIHGSPSKPVASDHALVYADFPGL